MLLYLQLIVLFYAAPSTPTTINVHVDPNKLRDLIETQEQSAVVLIILINAVHYIMKCNNMRSIPPIHQQTEFQSISRLVSMTMYNCRESRELLLLLSFVFSAIIIILERQQFH